MLSKEELLKPRYKVIADFPGMEDYGLKVGEIVDSSFHRDLISNLNFLNKYPHLFKKLEWWEEREEGDLPKYLKSFNSDTFYKVLKYNVTSGDVWVESFNGISISIIHFVPATQEEYEQYQSK
jgi:hypothetical protein